MHLYFNKPIKYATFGIVFAIGFGHYVYNAVSDYGLRTNKLHDMVAAQSDNTSTHDNSYGSCDGMIITCGQYLQRTLHQVTQSTDRQGNLTAFGINFGTYKKTTNYVVTVLHLHCEDSSCKKNVCDTRNQRFEKVSVSEGTLSSDGTTTSGR